MLAIKIEITRLVDDAGYPAIVECSMVDANGRQHLFIEKLPIVTTRDLHANSDYPAQGSIACELINSSLDAHKVVVSTERPDHVDSTEMCNVFEVHRDQLTDTTVDCG